MEFNFIEDLETIKTITQNSWSEIAEMLNVDYSTLSRWRNGTSKPSDRMVENIYNYLYKNNFRINRLLEENFKDNQTENCKILFHGSKEGIKGKLSISFSNEKRDFGKGFYLGESVKQAISFVSSFPKSWLYTIKIKNFKKLKIKEFDVCKEWMILVAYYRGKLEEYKNSRYLESLVNSIKDVDVVIAPIADNSMYSIINDFIEGSITDLQCVNSLSANRLGKQFVVLNDKTLDNNVEIVKTSYLCALEKEDYEIEKETEINIGKNKMILAKRKYAGQGLYIEEILK